MLNIFPSYDWDDKFGYILCATSPFNIFLPFMLPFTFINQNDEEKLKKMNEYFALMYYIPFAIVLTVWFSFINAFLWPIAIIVQNVRLFVSIFGETSFKNSCKRTWTFTKFLFAGFFIGAYCIIFDPFIFFYNLFGKPQHDHLNNEFEVKKFNDKGI